MCDQSKKAARPGAPASRVAREIFPVDYQILQCYNEDAGNDTRELAQKGDATCTVVESGEILIVATYRESRHKAEIEKFIDDLLIQAAQCTLALSADPQEKGG